MLYIFCTIRLLIVYLLLTLLLFKHFYTNLNRVFTKNYCVDMLHCLLTQSPSKVMPNAVISHIQVLPTLNKRGDPYFCVLFSVGPKSYKVPYCWIDNMQANGDIRLTTLPLGKEFDSEVIGDNMEEYSGHRDREPFIEYLIEQMRQRQQEQRNTRIEGNREYRHLQTYYMDVALINKPYFGRNTELKRELAHYKDTQANSKEAQKSRGNLEVQLDEALQPLKYSGYVFDAYERNLIWIVRTVYPIVALDYVTRHDRRCMTFQYQAKKISQVVTTNSRITMMHFLTNIHSWPMLTPDIRVTRTNGAPSKVPMPEGWKSIRTPEDYLKLSHRQRRELIADSLTTLSYCAVLDMAPLEGIGLIELCQSVKRYTYNPETDEMDSELIFKTIDEMHQFYQDKTGRQFVPPKLKAAQKTLDKHQASQRPTQKPDADPTGAGVFDHLPEEQRRIMIKQRVPDVAKPPEEQGEEWDAIWWDQLRHGIPFQGELAPTTTEGCDRLSTRLREKFGGEG